MNKHIAGIIKSSGIHDDMLEQCMFGDAHTYEMIDDDLSKFAETIVQECIRQIQMGIARDGYDTPEYRRSIKHITDIKRYFSLI